MSTARAELVKLVTLPALALTVGLTWAVTALITLAATGDPDPIPLARAGFLVLGVLAAASEHEGGQWRTTLLATPRRGRLQAVRTVVLGLAVVPVAAVTVLIAGRGGIASLVLITLTAAGVTTVLRHALAGVVVMLGYSFVLSPFLGEETAGRAVLVAAGVLLVATAVVVRRDTT